MKVSKILSLLVLCLLAACSDDDDAVNVLDTSKVSQVEDFVDERDGRTYKCVRIGNQIWMAENLAYYVPEGVMGGCYTWNERILEEETIAAQTEVVVTNKEWLDALKSVYDTDDRYYNHYRTEWTAGYNAWMAVYGQGYTQKQAEEEYLMQYPNLYNDLKAKLPQPRKREEVIREHTDNAENGNGHYSEKNGYLYTLDAALEAVPEGWRLPSDEDWQKLEAVLGIPQGDLGQMNAWRGTNAGDFLKLGGAAGFEARFSGCNAWVYGKTMHYIRQDESAYFWASDETTLLDTEEEETEDGETIVKDVVIREGIIRQLAIYSSAIWRGTTRLDNGYRGVAYSVRCVKDAQ